MLENIKLAFHGIKAHKLRSGLTMLGVIIGISAIIAIASTIQGTNEQIKQNLIGAGNDSVTVQLYEDGYALDLSYYRPSADIMPPDEGVRQEILRLSEVEKVSFYTSRSTYDSVFSGNTPLSGGRLYGADSSYFDVYGYSVLRGRSFVEDDYSKIRKAALLDETAAGGLFPGGDPLGKTIEIFGEPFTVVGIIAKKDSFEPSISTLEDYYTYAEQDTGAVFVPDSVWPVICGFDEPVTVAVRAKSTDDMTSAGKKTADIINGALNLPQEGSVKYMSEDLLEQARELQALSSSARTQLLWIAGISLIVGGIGVMNIMLVSVTERRREIGLKKAVGARSRHILVQFLTEAAVLTAMGGVIGVALGIGFASLISHATSAPVSISVPIIVLAVLFSTAIGLAFGLFPAVKAARQNPIDALRQQ